MIIEMDLTIVLRLPDGGRVGVDRALLSTRLGARRLEPQPPFGECSRDPTEDALGCLRYKPCE